jgi:hypothetical protein
MMRYAGQWEGCGRPGQLEQQFPSLLRVLFGQGYFLDSPTVGRCMVNSHERLFTMRVRPPYDR